MDTITIPKKEYKKLKQRSAEYVKLTKAITETEQSYPYDYNYIDKLVREARVDYKKGRCVEADSVDEALKIFNKR